MKIPLLLCLATLIIAPLGRAEQTVDYPTDKPIVSLEFPDDWDVKLKKGSVFGHPKDDPSVLAALSVMEAGSGDIDAAIKEAKDLIEADFKNVEWDKPEKGETGGVEMLILNAKGDDEDGRANINVAIIGRQGEESLVKLECISSKEGAEAHGEALNGVFHSIKAAGGEGPASEEAAPVAQTFSYPDKEHPVYAIDFPADWKMETTDEGAYVESPDKLVAMNLLFIDMADVDVAVESLKKKTGEKYESIEWNGGGEPQVNKDESLGLTATFNNGVATDGDTKYVVNFAQYTKAGADKFLVLICQMPKAALETHADAIEKTLRSIKVGDGK